MERNNPLEDMQKSKPVIASAAKQSSITSELNTYASPRRCAPGDQGRMQNFPQVTSPG
jgi:hypothetical protein